MRAGKVSVKHKMKASLSFCLHNFESRAFNCSIRGRRSAPRRSPHSNQRTPTALIDGEMGMTKVPQIMSDRPRYQANAGKFIVQRLFSNTPIDVLVLPFWDRDVDGEAVTIFDTLEAADAAAALMNEQMEPLPGYAQIPVARAVHLVNALNGPRIYRAA
jgi:hypothetical protein